MALIELVGVSRNTSSCDYCTLPFQPGQDTIVLKTGKILTPPQESDKVEMEVDGVHTYHKACVLLRHKELVTR